MEGIDRVFCDGSNEELLEKESSSSSVITLFAGGSSSSGNERNRLCDLTGEGGRGKAVTLRGTCFLLLLELSSFLSSSKLEDEDC
mmetsp:Transcript_49461/g.142277  ORF Transcript_49461/g.142277 Transcript_49461/m.142277 type:complete len:85 (+) Transcript_49461:451-705(+)